MKLPSVYIPGFRFSAKDGPAQNHTSNKDHGHQHQGYQPSHQQLAGEFMRRAAMTHSANSGEFLHVKAILAHFPHGSTTATMIRVRTLPAMSLYVSHVVSRTSGRW
jgi:hypothetical protein